MTFTIFPKLNRLFLPSTTGSVSEYSHLEETKVPDVVLDALTEWRVRETKVK